MDAQRFSDQFIGRNICPDFPAFIAYFLDALSQVFNEPGPVKHIGNAGIIRLRFMRFHQCVDGPSFRQNATVADRDSVFHHPDLDWSPIHIAIVDDCIVDCFADRLACERISLSNWMSFFPIFRERGYEW